MAPCATTVTRNPNPSDDGHLENDEPATASAASGKSDNTSVMSEAALRREHDDYGIFEVAEGHAARAFPGTFRAGRRRRRCRRRRRRRRRRWISEAAFTFGI